MAYSSAKGAVLTLTRGLAKELGARKIRVNAVSPGMIDTTFHDTFTKPEIRQATASKTLVGREGTSEDVANAVLFLASDASAYITGDSIEINGAFCRSWMNMQLRKTSGFGLSPMLVTPYPPIKSLERWTAPFAVGPVWLVSVE